MMMTAAIEDQAEQATLSPFIGLNDDVMKE
jgi:hypothetical protein